MESAANSYDHFDLEVEMRRSYLDYAMQVITGRGSRSDVTRLAQAKTDRQEDRACGGTRPHHARLPEAKQPAVHLKARVGFFSASKPNLRNAP
jgi:uncharacterized protein (DUF2345 family)